MPEEVWRLLDGSANGWRWAERHGWTVTERLAAAARAGPVGLAEAAAEAVAESLAISSAERSRVGECYDPEDIRIWEHKVYRDRPRICDGDGPIGRLRTWYRQFFTDEATHA